jgi:hypothetical protein
LTKKGQDTNGVHTAAAAAAAAAADDNDYKIRK